MEKDALEAAIGALEASIRTIDFWVLFFAVIVAGSLTFEAVFSVSHFLKDRKLPPLRAELVRIHATESLKLEADVADAKDRAAKSELALEKYKAPRVLTTDQVELIADRLRPFAGQEYDLALPGLIEPGSNIHTMLVSALKKAGWILKSFEGPPPKREIDLAISVFLAISPALPAGTHSISLPHIEYGVRDGMVGILVGIKVGDHPTAPIALFDALQGAGVEGAALTLLEPLKLGIHPTKIKPATVHLIIGRKN